MARPKISRERQHTASVRIWLTPKDKLAFEHACAARGQTSSSIGRALIAKFMDGDIITISAVPQPKADQK